VSELFDSEEETGEMSEIERTTDEAEHGEVGDVEDAGETTAADTVSGPEDERPVGEGTEVEVEENQNRER
jgi:hypothetical protein